MGSIQRTILNKFNHKYRAHNYIFSQSVAYIYSITNNINQKKYIGKTSQTNPYTRWKQHLQLARNKNNLQENNSAHSMPIVRAISKYGESNFKFRVLEECTEESVNEREEHYIRKYNTADGAGYNCTYGGDGIKKPKKYWSNHPSSKAVSCYTLDGEWVRDYETQGLAAAELNNGESKSSIKTCIKGTTFQAFGYRWAWKGEPLKEVKNRVNRRGKIYGVHPESGRKKMWKSQADCAEDINNNRKDNNSLTIALARNVEGAKSMVQVKGWYLFRDKHVANSDWKKAERNTFDSQRASELSAISAEKRKKPVRGVNITTGEEVRFDSISEASFFIKGDKNYKAVANIKHNIQNIKDGKTWSYAFGYKWYELT